MARRPEFRWESAEMNMATYFDYLHRMKSIGINRIEYEWLPETVNPRFVELGLWEQGAMIWFYDKALESHLCLPFTGGSTKTFTGEPREREAYAYDGIYRKQLNDKNSVIIYNNYSHRPDYPTINLFAMRMADVKRTQDVNIKNQKTPKIIMGSDKQRLAMKNLWMQWEGNEPVIFADDNFKEELKAFVLDVTAPYVTDKLEVQLHQMWNDVLSYYGIENGNQDKKERLVVDEANSNYGLVENSRNVALNSREDAIKRINEMWGLNVKVRFRSDVVSTVNNPNIGRSGEDG